LRTELHDLIQLDGKNMKGKVYVKKLHNFCDKPSCPKCYAKGWAVRQANSIEDRLAEARKRGFGIAEHLTISVPPEDYGVEYEVLRKKAKKILFSCGVVGGVMVWHAFRYNRIKSWYFSPHLHVLGFINGGYNRCRHCKDGDCYACDGFEGRVYRLYRKNRWIVEVMSKWEERKSIGATAWYQLNHSSIDVTKKRFHVATWFGVVSYRKLKLTIEKRKARCPICGHELVPLLYFGKKNFVVDRDSPDYEHESYEDYIEDGVPVWFEDTRERWRKGLL
jgi:uncharacterized protein with PIN domain